MAFKDKEEFFDGLFAHIFDGDTPDDTDQEWFEKTVIPFFDQFPGFSENSDNENQNENSSPTRRRKSSGGVSGPRRKRRQPGNNSGYGANVFFGGN